MPVITPHIPDGLIELMKTLAKSVLKEKPENIHEFAAEHFKNLLIERDGSLDKGYEKSKSCEKCLTPKEKAFMEFVLNNRPKLFNESNLKTSKTSEQESAENKFRPRKLSSKKPSEILLSIKEEDEGTQKLSEKEKIAACIIQKAFKAYIERRQLQENGHPGNESDGMTEEAAAIIIQKALKKVLGGNKSVVKNNVVTKPEISSENDNEENIDKQINSEGLENCTVVDVLDKNRKSINENSEGEVEKELGENEDVSKADEDNDITTNITTQKNRAEDVQQNDDISRQDTLPMDETAEIYKDEIGTQEIGHTNDLARKDDKNMIATERNVSMNNDNSQHFATLPEVARNESELINKKALWYVGEEPIITSTEENISSSHIEKDLTNLMNTKNIINTPESTLSKTLRESAVGANHSTDAPLSMIYDSLEFNNNNQLADASIEADSLQNISEIKNYLNFVSTEIKSIGGQVQGDSIGVELTSDAKPEARSSSEARQNDTSESLDAKAEEKLLVVDSRNQEGNKNGIIEEAKQIEETKENINSDSQSEKEIEKSSEFSETKAELSEGSVMLTSDSTKIKYDIEEVDDGSKKPINYEESTITDEHVDEVAKRKNVNQVETAPENTQTTTEFNSTLLESTKHDEESGKQDRNIPDNVSLKIVNVNSPADSEGTSVKNIDETSNSVDTDIEKEERPEISESTNRSNPEIEEVLVTQTNNEIVTASFMQNKQTFETNVDDYLYSDNGIIEEANVSTPPDTHERRIQEAEENIVEPKKDTNLILSADTKSSLKQNSIEQNIMKKEVTVLRRQLSESSNDDKPPQEPITNLNKDFIMENSVVDGAIETEDKSKDVEENNKSNDVNAQDSNKIEENALKVSTESESHRQSKLLVEEEIPDNQTDESVKISTEDACKTIPAQPIENKCHEVTAKETGQHLPETEINKKVEVKFEKVNYSTDKQNESSESQEKSHFDENIKEDNIENQIITTEKSPSMKENPENARNLTNVQEKTENEESEEKPNASDIAKTSADEHFLGYKSVKSESDKNIKNIVENQTNDEKESPTVEENLENSKNLRNFQGHKEINEECEEKPNINHNIEPSSDKQRTSDNDEVSNSVKCESTENINENKVEIQAIAQKKSQTGEESFTNVQGQEEVNESNDNIKLAYSKKESEGNGQDNVLTQSIDKEKLNISQDKENEATEKLEEANENHEEDATKNIPGNLENIQSITENNNENISENIAENNNNSNSQGPIHVDDAVDHKNQADAENNSDVTETKDVHIEKDKAKIDDSEYVSNEIKESSVNDIAALEEQKMTNQTYLVFDDDKRENRKKAAKENEKEEKATELPSVIADDNIDQQENIIEESPVQENSSDSIPIPSTSEAGDGLGGETVHKDEPQEEVAEDEVKIKQSTKLMEDPAPINKTKEQEDDLKKSVNNSSLTNLNPSDISTELNNESNSNSSVANYKGDSADEEVVEVTKPRDYVNTNLVPANKIAADEPKKQSEILEPALTTSDSIEDKEQSAIQIQKMYRGYKTRKYLKNKAVDADSVEPEIAPAKNASHLDGNKDGNVIDAVKEQQNTQFDSAEEESALTIQKNFRGYRARRDLKGQFENYKEIKDSIADINDTKQNSLSEGIKNHPDEDKAAIIIQKNYRGYKTKQQIQSSINAGSASNNEISEKENRDETIEQYIDEHTLSEEDAALTIQKNFRGYKTRKQIKTANSKEDSSKEVDKNQIILTENATDEEAAAAVTIQKTYRGYKSKSELKKRKEENLDSKLEQKSALIEESDKKNKENYASREQTQSAVDFSVNEKVVNNVEIAAQSTNVDNNFSPKQIKQVEKVADKTSDILIENKEEEENVIDKNEEQILATDINNKTEEKIIEEEQDKNEEQIILQKKDNSLNSSVDINSKEDENSENTEKKEEGSNENVSLDKNKKEGALTIQKNYRGYIVRKKLRLEKKGKSCAKEQQSSENGEHAEQNKETIEDSEPIDKNEESAALIIQKSYHGHKIRKDLKTDESASSNRDQQSENIISEEKNKGQDEQHFVNMEQKSEIDKKESEAKKCESQEENSENDSSAIKEKAAVAIQKTYKGYKTRRDLKQIKEQETEKHARETNPEVPQLKEEDEAVMIQKNYKGHTFRKSLKEDSDLNSDGKVGQDHNKTQTEHQPVQEQETISQTKLAEPITPIGPVNTGEISDDTPNSNNDREQEEAALTIQKNYREYQVRRTLKSKSNAESTEIDKKSVSAKSDTRNQKTDEEAALTIQKNYRGYRTKRDVSRGTGQDSNDDDNTSLNKEKAAVTIQRNFRGYKTRQILKKGKSPLIESISDEVMPETDVDRNASMEQAEENQENPNENEEIPITKRFSAISATGLSDAETTRAESRSTINDEMSDIENVDLSSYADDSLEGMYYSLRKNEITLDRMQRRASERKNSLTKSQPSGQFDSAIYEPVQQISEFQKASSTETNDGLAPNSSKSNENQIIVANKKNQELLENIHRSNSQPYQIIESDNEKTEPQQESYVDDLDNYEQSTQAKAYSKASDFQSPTEAITKKSEEFLDKLHGTLQNVNQPTIDEDTSATIRKKMLAYSVSEADSDYCEVAEEKINAIRDDFNISTALETVTSTDTDSTIISAATKIQAGARGFLTRRRLRRASVGAISTQSEKNASFGNDAIDESLENLIEENTTIKIQNSYRGYMQHKSHTTPSPSPTEEIFSSKSKDSDDKNMGITDIKLEHKLSDSQDTALVKDIFEADKINGSSMTENEKTDDLTRSTSTEDESPIVVNLDELNLAARRLTLQRGDAVQKDSTPEDDAENVASSEERVKDEKEISNTTDKGKRRRAELTKLFGTRQRTMPVQIDSEILRVIPKHLRKRIKSAEAQKKKRNNLQ